MGEALPMLPPRRALVADLQGGEALQQLAEVRVFVMQCGVAVGEGGGGAYSRRSSNGSTRFISSICRT